MKHIGRAKSANRYLRCGSNEPTVATTHRGSEAPSAPSASSASPAPPHPSEQGPSVCSSTSWRPSRTSLSSGPTSTAQMPHSTGTPKADCIRLQRQDTRPAPCKATSRPPIGGSIGGKVTCKGLLKTLQADHRNPSPMRTAKMCFSPSLNLGCETSTCAVAMSQSQESPSSPSRGCKRVSRTSGDDTNSRTAPACWSPASRCLSCNLCAKRCP
mmetsp:Transcript_147067/g.472296  ORF Transcript_147067/g.472296 Transcript_147067/m.472296 type:complete len:213 (-) Transcript_147067:5017-5655(-)